MKISLPVLLVLAAWLCVAAASPAHADPPELYLTWHAPFGEPRAADTLAAAKCDTSLADTLWLSFDPGKPSPTYLGYMATLLIHPALGDTLARWWTKDFGKGKPPFFDIGLEPEPGYGYPMPYKKNGGGGTAYDGVLKDARYRLIYATPYDKAVAIERKHYVLARLIIRRPPASDPACGRPICIEWSESELNYDIGNSRAFISTGAHRIVTLNSPGGEVATPYRRAAQLNGWKLKTP